MAYSIVNTVQRSHFIVCGPALAYQPKNWFFQGDMLIMYRKLVALAVLLSGLLMLAGLAAAQPRPQTESTATPTKRLTLSDPYSMQIPAGWVTQDEQDGVYVFGPDGEIFIVLDPVRIPDVADIPADATPEERVDALVEAIYGELFYNAGNHEQEVIGGLRATMVYYIAGEDDEYEGKLGVARLPDGEFVYFDYMTLDGELESPENVALLDEMIASLAAPSRWRHPARRASSAWRRPRRRRCAWGRASIARRWRSCRPAPSSR
jgi:hypothetical protein